MVASQCLCWVVSPQKMGKPIPRTCSSSPAWRNQAHLHLCSPQSLSINRGEFSLDPIAGQNITCRSLFPFHGRSQVAQGCCPDISAKEKNRHAMSGAGAPGLSQSRHTAGQGRAGQRAACSSSILAFCTALCKFCAWIRSEIRAGFQRALLEICTPVYSLLSLLSAFGRKRWAVPCRARPSTGLSPHCLCLLIIAAVCCLAEVSDLPAL